MLNILMSGKIVLDKLIEFALTEDIGCGDITVNAVSEFLGDGKCYFLAKQDFILCGCDVVKRVFWHLNEALEVNFKIGDGDFVKSGEKFGEISGKLKDILTGERVALNFLQRLSGIATNTNKYVEKLKGTNIKLLDTRKTTPGHRILEKYAVKVGGGYNHRFGLFDGVMLKDNHIDAAGGIKEAVEAVKDNIPATVKIEVECRTLLDVKDAVEAGVDIIMLDNFKLDEILEARRIAKGIKVEVSGGITLENIDKYIQYDVDYISVGSLTHNVKSVDISLKFND
jgi:nicotinate-nucleotide pyrophosphorylase (carboxylating)